MIRPTKRRETQASEKSSGMIYQCPEKKQRWGEKLARNVAFAGLLTLSVTAVRNAELPSGKTLLSAVQGIIDTSWDNDLGKISFVSSLLPESMVVFFETDLHADLTVPCFGSVEHAWTNEEPFLGYSTNGGNVYAIASGQVMSIAHGLDEERIVRMRHKDGLESLYYNLSAVNVQEGDEVTVSTCLGSVLPGKLVLLEVRRAGRAIDPESLLSPRKEMNP